MLQSERSSRCAIHIFTQTRFLKVTICITEPSAWIFPAGGICGSSILAKQEEKWKSETVLLIF